MYIGIEINPDRTFTVAVMNEDRNVVYISNFWKEGLYWFLDHMKGKILTVNINFSDRKYSQIKEKLFFELKDVLISNFEYEPFTKEKEKVFALTDTDRFFEKAIRKELLPIYTREGLEQRLYNLPKSGIYFPEIMKSKSLKKLRSEVNAIISAFTSYCIQHGLYTKENIADKDLVVPIYKYVPKSKRVVSNL